MPKTTLITLLLEKLFWKLEYYSKLRETGPVQHVCHENNKENTVIIISFITSNYYLFSLYMAFYVYAHLNTCADRQRCESESFSTKWSGGRERNKEMCSCQGSGELRLLPEILWKNHTFEGLVLCCLRISSSDQWNKGEKKRGGERERGRPRE